MEEKLLVDWKTLKKMGWPYSRTHTNRLIKAGVLPAPLKLGQHERGRVAWRWKDIHNFLDGLQQATYSHDEDVS